MSFILTKNKNERTIRELSLVKHTCWANITCILLLWCDICPGKERQGNNWFLCFVMMMVNTSNSSLLSCACAFVKILYLLATYSAYVFNFLFLLLSVNIWSHWCCRPAKEVNGCLINFIAFMHYSAPRNINNTNTLASSLTKLEKIKWFLLLYGLTLMDCSKDTRHNWCNIDLILHIN